ncbi:glycosyltransferase family 2 protein [Longirhabdus pacifica]|uniref:glycosyltransferase family 2 protein n=1 Tax=Longirhabdus pacifica TaxID=2305227 RepID=UPI001008AFAE|nr:glycosyltransferase family 2 protein [Longirhabdus pacifica]
MNIVIPIAGEGKRFKQAGFQVPKMLVETRGRPMLYWALDSLQPIIQQHHVVFVCLERDLAHFPLQSIILQYCSHAEIISLDQVAEGQAATVLKAAPLLHDNESLLIYNGDTYSVMNTDVFKNKSCDGIIPVFPSQDPAYSYVQVDGQNNVLSVKEKEVISPYATTGCYHFSSTSLFVEAAQKMIQGEDKVLGEYYVAPLYNTLVQQGYTFMIHEVDVCHPIGTPQQWQQFQDLKELAGGR